MRTIAHISDLHFGRHSRDLMEGLLSSINDARPDLVVLSGDFTQRARQAEFAEARQFLKRLRYPKLIVPGNHDVPLYNLFRRFHKPWAKFDRYLTPMTHSTNFFRDEELAVLGLNSARPFSWKNGRISHQQIAEIRQVFSEVPCGVFKALVTHHPLEIPDGATKLELARRSRLVLGILADAGVHLLLSGHHHRGIGGLTQLSAGRSVLIVHAGTAISTRTRENDGNSYNLIKIIKPSISLHLMTWVTGSGFRQTRISNFGLNEDQTRSDVGRVTSAQ